MGKRQNVTNGKNFAKGVISGTVGTAASAVLVALQCMQDGQDSFATNNLDQVGESKFICPGNALISADFTEEFRVHFPHESFDVVAADHLDLLLFSEISSV